MRIISGTMKGRQIDVPARGVRPTLDRVRESVFGMLGDFVAAADVLDLYAGSGALGLEALSRGARNVCWVESSRSVLKVLRRNVDKLSDSFGGVSHQIYSCAAVRFIARQDSECFDLIFADPPYEKNGSGENLAALLDTLKGSGKLKPGGLLVYEMAASEKYQLSDPWQLVREKRWGETRVLFISNTLLRP